MDRNQKHGPRAVNRMTLLIVAVGFLFIAKIISSIVVWDNVNRLNEFKMVGERFTFEQGLIHHAAINVCMTQLGLPPIPPLKRKGEN